MKQFGYMAVIVLLAAACGGASKYRTEIDANNLTAETLEDVIQSLEQLDDSAVNTARNQRLERLQAIEATLNSRGDTLNAKEARGLAEISAAGEPYHPFSVETGTVASKLRRSHDQLKALNHDMEHNLLPDDSVKYMVNHEREFAEKALREADILMEEAGNEMATQNSWYRRIDSLEKELIPARK